MAVCALHLLFLFTISLNLIVISSHLISSHLISSHLISSHAFTIAYIYPGMYAAAADKYKGFGTIHAH